MQTFFHCFTLARLFACSKLPTLIRYTVYKKQFLNRIAGNKPCQCLNWKYHSCRQNVHMYAHLVTITEHKNSQYLKEARNLIYLCFSFYVLLSTCSDRGVKTQGSFFPPCPPIQLCWLKTFCFNRQSKLSFISRQKYNHSRTILEWKFSYLFLKKL